MEQDQERKFTRSLKFLERMVALPSCISFGLWMVITKKSIQTNFNSIQKAGSKGLVLDLKKQIQREGIGDSSAFRYLSDSSLRCTPLPKWLPELHCCAGLFAPALKFYAR